MEQHRTITFEGRTMHYRDEGRDNHQTLVLLHGFMQNLDVWTSYVLSYMNHLRVITIDLPGHGLSDLFCDTHSMDFMARAVKSVLTHAGVENCVMMGHSMGGYVALAFAEANPYMLRGLGLVNSHALADNDEHRAYRDDVCKQVQSNRAAFIVKFVPSLFDPSCHAALSHDMKDIQDQCLEMRSESIIAAQRGMAQRPSRLNLLGKLDIPVLFVYGKNDNRIPLELAVSQAMIPARAEIHLLENVGHMSFIEQREYLKPRLLNFVHTCYV